MTDHDFNRLVAEKVMGWRRINPLPSHLSSCHASGEKPQFGDWWLRPENKDYPILAEWGVPNYSEPANDYAVHEKVNREWKPAGRLSNYYIFLECILCEAGGDNPDGEPSLWSMCYYRPGMFAKAALEVHLHMEAS